MDPGIFPPELLDLSLIEKQWISPIHAVISVYRVRGQQFAFSGQMTNFPQNIQQFCTRLPRNTHDLSLGLIVRKVHQDTHKDLCVRRMKVMRALQ